MSHDIKQLLEKAEEAVKGITIQDHNEASVEAMCPEKKKKRLQEILLVLKNTPLIPFQIIGVSSDYCSVESPPTFYIDLNNIFNDLREKFELQSTDEEVIDQLLSILWNLYKRKDGRCHFTKYTLCYLHNFIFVMSADALCYKTIMHGMDCGEDIRLTLTSEYGTRFNVVDIKSHADSDVILHIESARQRAITMIDYEHDASKQDIKACLNFLKALEPVIKSINWELTRAAYVLKTVSRAAGGIISPDIQWVSFDYKLAQDKLSENIITL